MVVLACFVPSTSFPFASLKIRSTPSSCIRKFVVNVVPKIIRSSAKRQFGPPSNGLNHKLEFCRPSSDISFENKHTFPKIVVIRSELARARSLEASYSMVEFQLGAKVRGICFYSVFAFVAIILFLLMIVAYPFVLLFDYYQRRNHHLIAKI